MPSLPYRPEGQPPDWFTDRIIGWNEYNPLFHLWNLLSDPNVAQVSLDAQRFEIANQIGSYLVQAVCTLTLPDYNEAVLNVDPVLSEIRDKWGARYVPPWFGDRAKESGVLTPDEYVALRELHGCPVKAPLYTQPPPGSYQTEKTGVLAAIGRRPVFYTGIALIGGGIVIGLAYRRAKAKKGRRKKKMLPWLGF